MKTNIAAQKSWDSFCREGAGGIQFENMPLEEFKIAYSGTLSMLNLENVHDREQLLNAIWRFGVISEAQGHESEVFKEVHVHFDGLKWAERWRRRIICFLNLHNCTPKWNDRTNFYEHICDWCGAVKTHDSNTGHSHIQFKG